MAISLDQAPARATVRIPALIKRNIALFALSQSFTGAGMQFAYGLGPLMVIALTGSPSLAGLSVGLIGFSRFLVSYPIGKITDAYGRKPGILLGLLLALIGALILGTSLSFNSAALFVVGMVVFAMGMYGAQQLRVAATDMVLPHMRGQALGYIAMGSLVGLVISPLVVYGAEHVAPRLDMNPLEPAVVLPARLDPDRRGTGRISSIPIRRRSGRTCIAITKAMCRRRGRVKPTSRRSAVSLCCAAAASASPSSPTARRRGTCRS